MKNKNIVALLPMRHFSSRVKGKNYKLLNGKPLFTYVLNALIKSKVFKKIIINTDSPIIKKKLANFKNIIIHDRPYYLRSGFISMNKIIEYDCKKIDYNFVFQTHSTNPFLKVSTIKKAVNHYFKKRSDTLFAVNLYQTRLWNHKLQAVNHNPNKLVRTQDLEPLYEENSLFYIFNRKKFLKNKNRIFGKKSIFVTDPLESVDIDNMSNWEYAKYLSKKHNSKKSFNK